MKAKTVLRGLALAGSLFLAVLSANAQIYVFEPFETDGVDDLADLEPISLAAHLIDTGSGMEVVISNESMPGDGWITDTMPTVTRVFFEDGGDLLFAASFDSSGSVGVVDFDYQDGGNLPGGANIGFETAFSFIADPPPVVKGIDPMESASFSFEGSDYELVRQAINSTDLRIGLHVQQIGKCGEDSASYIINPTPIPEPATALLGALGLLVVFRRKR